MDLLMIFIILSIINVIFSTIKSIVTVKGGAVSASLLSALYYGYYNIVLIYTVAEFPLWQKVVVTFGCNLVGVFVVKWAEEKARKDIENERIQMKEELSREVIDVALLAASKVVEREVSEKDNKKIIDDFIKDKE